MRVLEVEQSGKKTKKGQNPLLINQIDLPKNQEILQMKDRVAALLENTK